MLIGYALYGQFSNVNCFGIGSYQNGIGCIGGLLWTATVLLMQPIVMAATVVFSVLILTRLYVEIK